MMTSIKWLMALDRLIASIEKYFLSLMLLTMLFLSFIQVVLRDFFNSGLSWSDVLVRYMVLWIGFMGASLATKDDRHLRIDALNKALPKKVIPLVELFVYFGCIVVGCFLFDAAYQFVLSEQEGGKMLFSGAIPAWYFLVIMPFGFGMITFRYFIRLTELLFKFAGKKTDEVNSSELDISLSIKLK